MRRRISIRGCVRSSVGPSVRRSVTPSLRRLLGASYAEYSALFILTPESFYQMKIETGIFLAQIAQRAHHFLYIHFET